MEETSTAVKQAPPQSAEKFMRQVRRQNRRKFTAEEKIRVVLEGMKREISVAELCRREGIPAAAYYSWVKCFMEAGKRAWNRLTRVEELEVLRVAMAHPELSPRWVACRVSDESGFSLSESTAYRLLKREGLIRLRPAEEQPAGKAWEHKTQRPDEI